MSKAIQQEVRCTGECLRNDGGSGKGDGCQRGWASLAISNDGA